MIHYHSTPPGYGCSGTLCLTTALAPMPESKENTNWPNRNKLFFGCIILTEPLFKQKRRKAGLACWTARYTCLKVFQLWLQQGNECIWTGWSILLSFQQCWLEAMDTKMRYFCANQPLECLLIREKTYCYVDMQTVTIKLLYSKFV